MAKGIERWASGNAYKSGDYVDNNENEIFYVVSNHTSTVFDTDLAAGRLLPASDRPRLFLIAMATLTVTPTRKNCYLIDTNFNAVELTIDSTRAKDGLEIIIKKVGGVYPLTILFTGGGTIDGRTSEVLTGAMESIRLVYDYDLTIWWVV